MLSNVQLITLNIGILFNTIVSVIIFYIWTENKKKYNDMKYFFISQVFCIFYLLGSIFNMQFEKSFNIIIALCGLGYYSFLLIAFQKFYSVKTARYTPIVYGFIAYFLTIYSYIYQHYVLIKIFSFSIILILTIQLIIVLWKHRKLYKKVHYGIITILLFQFVLRTLLYVSASSIENFNASPFFLSTYVPTISMSKIIISIGVVFLTDRRRKTDIDIMNKTIENVFTLSSEGIIINSLSGEFLHINNSFCKMTGYSEKELLKFSWRDIIHQKNVKEIEQIYKESRDKNQDKINLQIETRIIKKNNSIIWVLVLSSLVTDLNNNPLYYISNVTKIDELKTRTLELEISEKNLRIAKEKAEKLNNAKSDFLAVISHETRTPMTTILGITRLLILILV